MSKKLEAIDYSNCRAMCSFAEECLVEHELTTQTDPVFFETENLARLERRRIELGCVVFSRSAKKSTS